MGIDILDQDKELMIVLDNIELGFALIPDNATDAFNKRFLSTKVKFMKGKTYFKENLLFNGNYNSNATLHVTSFDRGTLIYESDNAIDLKFKVHFGKCHLGDYFDIAV